MFILRDVEELTDNWHSGGGLVVIANDLEHAKEVVRRETDAKVTESEWNDAEEFTLIESDDYEAQAYVFPDAGCC